MAVVWIDRETRRVGCDICGYQWTKHRDVRGLPKYCAKCHMRYKLRR